jgi:D-alanyl-D-alanine carboxypeptidase
MRNGVIAVLAGAGMAVFAATAFAAAPREVGKVQAALDAWLAARAPIEKVTGIAAYISLGASGPAIEAFAGKVGRDPDSGPVDQDTLYQMGSTSKSFAVAVILQLEAAGKLSIDDPLGKWLPEYPAWKDVTLRRLLNMTSDIPNYSETEWMSQAWEKEPMRALTLKQLADAAYPSATNQLPVTNGYHYSNTNYALAGMIAEKVSGKSFRDLVHELVIEPQGLTSTFYEASTYPEPVIKRLSHGYFENLHRVPTQMQRNLECPDHRAGHAQFERILDAIGRRRRQQCPRRRSLDARGFRREGGSAEAAKRMD